MQATKFGDGGNWGKISFDLRTFHDKKTVTKFSLEQYLGNYTGAKFELSEIGASNVDVLSEINAALTGVVAVDKLHLEFSCYTSDFNEEKLSVKISTIDENPQTWSKDITLAYNNESQSMVSSPKYFVWHAEKWSGVISNYSLTFENLF